MPRSTLWSLSALLKNLMLIDLILVLAAHSLDQFAPHQQPPAACSALTTLSPHLAARRPAAPAAAPATPAGPAWGELPSDALAVIINDCGLAQSDVAAVRLTCRHWRHTSCCWLQSLSPACASLEQVADIAARFPYLTSVDLTRCDTRCVCVCVRWVARVFRDVHRCAQGC